MKTITMTCEEYHKEFIYPEEAYDLIQQGKFKEAFYMLTSEDMNGSVRAQYLLGCMYGNGDYVHKNIEVANYYFGLAADKKFEPAMYIYALNIASGPERYAREDEPRL